jgi:hypothetical protein
MTEAPNQLLGHTDGQSILGQVDQLRRRIFLLIDTVLASDCEIAPDVADSLQRAANELGLMEAGIRYTDRR